VGSAVEGGPVDWGQGYGYRFWMSRHGYRGDGAFGQFCVILPEQDTVIVTTAYTLAMPALLDAIWDHLLPGLSSDSPDAASQERLSARLARLELAACPGAPAPADWGAWAGTFTIAASTADTRAQPFLFSLEARPFLTSIEVGPEAEVIFLETPHRMDITCSLPRRSAEAGWRHPPLTPSRLKQLHCPS
jgi:hypothetical protein